MKKTDRQTDRQTERKKAVESVTPVSRTSFTLWHFCRLHSLLPTHWPLAAN